MSLPVELESSVTQLRAKHTDLVAAVNAYLSGTVTGSKQDLLNMGYDLHRRIETEEKALIGQIARKGRAPSVVLDFVNGKFAKGSRRIETFSSMLNTVRFARSSGGGRYNENGEYEWVAAGVPRIDYDPVTKVCRGLLVEGQRTNLFAYSRPSFDGGYYSASHGGHKRLEMPPGVPSVEGFTMAQSAEIVNYGMVSLNRQMTLEKGKTYTVSALIYVPSSHTGISSLSVFTNAGGWANLKQTNFSERDRFVWKSVTFTVPSSTDQIVLASLISGGQAGDKVYVAAFQLEEGRFATSLIESNGAATTRAADVVAFWPRGFVNGRKGTVVIRKAAINPPAGVTMYFLDGRRTFLDGGAMIAIDGSGSLIGTVRGADGVSNTVDSGYDPVSGVSFKSAISWSNGRYSVASAGSVNSSGTYLDGTMFEEPISLMASHQGSSAFGHLECVEIYPEDSTTAELQELTL